MGAAVGGVAPSEFHRVRLVAVAAELAGVFGDEDRRHSVEVEFFDAIGVGLGHLVCGEQLGGQVALRRSEAAGLHLERLLGREIVEQRAVGERGHRAFGLGLGDRVSRQEDLVGEVEAVAEIERVERSDVAVDVERGGAVAASHREAEQIDSESGELFDLLLDVGQLEAESVDYGHGGDAFALTVDDGLRGLTVGHVIGDDVVGERFACGGIEAEQHRCLRRDATRGGSGEEVVGECVGSESHLGLSVTEEHTIGGAVVVIERVVVDVVVSDHVEAHQRQLPLAHRFFEKRLHIADDDPTAGGEVATAQQLLPIDADDDVDVVEVGGDAQLREPARQPQCGIFAN